MFLYNNPHFKPRRRELRRDQTDVEKFLWSHLRNNQFEGLKFFRQYGVGPFILDFYCPKIRLAIELDGGQHAEESNREYDEQRTNDLNANGITVIRFWNNDVIKNMEGVFDRIKTEITEGNPG